MCSFEAWVLLVRHTHTVVNKEAKDKAFCYHNMELEDSQQSVVVLAGNSCYRVMPARLEDIPWLVV